VIDLRYPQRSFGEGLIHETVDELWEDWMRQADAVLEDEALLATVYEGLQRRHPRSPTHGRPGTPAEVVLRMLLLKHIRDWSFVLKRHVEPVARRLGLNFVDWRCLRRSYATWLVQSGADPQVGAGSDATLACFNFPRDLRADCSGKSTARGGETIGVRVFQACSIVVPINEA
jgi:hypothetical protein